MSETIGAPVVEDESAARTITPDVAKRIEGGFMASLRRSLHNLTSGNPQGERGDRMDASSVAAAKGLDSDLLRNALENIPPQPQEKDL